jgi:hypothetical protein
MVSAISFKLIFGVSVARVGQVFHSGKEYSKEKLIRTNFT